MGCDETAGAIAGILIFMAHRDRVIFHDRSGRILFGTGDLHPLVTDLPRPPSQALVTAMHAEGLLDVIAADTQHGCVVYALTAEGRRVVRARPTAPADPAERIVDLRAGRLVVQTRHRLEGGRRRAAAMEERFRIQRALILRMRAKGQDTELAKQRLAFILIALIEMHRQQTLAQQFCAEVRAVRLGNRGRPAAERRFGSATHGLSGIPLA